MREEIKEKLIREAACIRKANKYFPVSGERFDIRADGRAVNVVYYTAKRKGRPLFIALHGGGFLLGGNAMNQPLWIAMQETLDINIASIEYRKSPEYMWRDALDDVLESMKYFYENSERYHYDPQQICLFGVSAGACLAATACIYAKEKGYGTIVKKQILMYPVFDFAADPDEKGEGSLNRTIAQIFNELHCSSDEAKNPLVSPVFAAKEELEGLPKAILGVAEYDNLKREGNEYADRLEAAGVEVTRKEFQGMPHGFIECGFGENFPGEFEYLDNEVKEKIGTGELQIAAQIFLEYMKQEALDQ